MATDEWSREQDLVFEYALVIYDENTVDRWEKIAAEVPGKTVKEIKRHYDVLVNDVNNIEAGNVPLPDYNSFPETEGGAAKKVAEPKIKRKRIRWTKDEHMLFLEGLEKIGQNDWKGISEKYVPTKTPKQVGDHGYNYFTYLKKERMRSINDVTNVKNGDFSALQGPNTGQKCISWKDEHRLFLEGLEKIGQNDWKGISEKYVLTKTPTQVGDHGYNCFTYLKKERMRSIFDVTNVKNGDFSALQGPNTGQACNSAASSAGQSVELAHAGVHAGINDAALPVGFRSLDIPSAPYAGIHATPWIGRPFESAIGTRVNLPALGSQMNLGSYDINHICSLMNADQRPNVYTWKP